MDRMRFATLRRQRAADLPGVAGAVRLDRRSRRVVPRLRPGDIVVIDHVDLDQVTAEALVAGRVGAVVNAAPSISGRFPNLGPEVLVAAGVPLLDGVGEAPFDELREGQSVRVDGDSLYLGDRLIATGRRQDAGTVAEAMTAARAGMSVQLQAFAAGTADYLAAERDLIIDGVGVPETRTEFAGRHVLVVRRGIEHKADLELLGPYIREFRPVLIGVESGADVLVEAGYTPDLVIGELEDTSDDVLRSGAEVIVHTTPDGNGPGPGRLDALGVAAVPFPAAASSDDLALLLSDVRGATLIVTAGMRTGLVEFLDTNHSGSASGFLTRLRVGGKLVDAQAVTKLYRPGISAPSLFFFVIAAVVALAAAVAASTIGRSYLQVLADLWGSAVFQLQRLFS
jgi:uncharacterized membrane-anchored protein